MSRPMYMDLIPLEDPSEPTSEQIQENAEIQTPIGKGFACWYPQMGGYVAKCIVVPNKNGGCFDAWVWHDGQFPFGGDNRVPAVIHHCDPKQFVRFGEWAASLPGMEDDERP